MNNIGYACINMELSEQPKSKRVTTNRSMIKRTFQERGVAYASELALANCRDLLTILKWNEAHGFKFFRLSSELFPWASEYKMSDLPDFDDIWHSALILTILLGERAMHADNTWSESSIAAVPVLHGIGAAGQAKEVS